MVVARAIFRLELQRYRSTDELRPVIDDYILALSDYVKAERDLARPAPTMRNAAGQAAILRREICRKLDTLDARRDEIRATMLLAAKKQKAAEAANEKPIKISSSTRR